MPSHFTIQDNKKEESPSANEELMGTIMESYMEVRVKSQAQGMPGSWRPFIDVQNGHPQSYRSCQAHQKWEERANACGQRVSLWVGGTVLELEGIDGCPF